MRSSAGLENGYRGCIFVMGRLWGRKITLKISIRTFLSECNFWNGLYFDRHQEPLRGMNENRLSII